MPIHTALVFSVILLAIPSQTRAQNSFGKFIGGVARDVAKDPTTYSPAAISWLGKKLDWDSSQIFFANGFVEGNKDFTISGLPNDTPISHAAGNKKIAYQGLSVFRLSLVNNATASAIERMLIYRYPKHRKLVKIASWTEKIAVNSYYAYANSQSNFRQWRINKDMAKQLGYR